MERIDVVIGLSVVFLFGALIGYSVFSMRQPKQTEGIPYHRDLAFNPYEAVENYVGIWFTNEVERKFCIHGMLNSRGFFCYQLPGGFNTVNLQSTFRESFGRPHLSITSMAELRAWEGWDR